MPGHGDLGRWWGDGSGTAKLEYIDAAPWLPASEGFVSEGWNSGYWAN